MPKASQAKQDEIVVNENFDVGKKRGLTFDHVNDNFECRIFDVYNIYTNEGGLDGIAPRPFVEAQGTFERILVSLE